MAAEEEEEEDLSLSFCIATDVVCSGGMSKSSRVGRGAKPVTKETQLIYAYCREANDRRAREFLPNAQPAALS